MDPEKVEDEKKLVEPIRPVMATTKMGPIEDTLPASVRATYIYRDVFFANYRGSSNEGKELKDFLKERDSGRTKVDYIPWGVMIRMAKSQDPDFTIEKIKAADGTFLHYNGRPDKDDPCYFVKVGVVFMGHMMTEDYPVQDFDFEPVNFTGRTRVLASGKTKTIQMDANIINKSLQRATAKVISQVTGLGLSLYETGDLQFEDDATGAIMLAKGGSAKPAAKTAPIASSGTLGPEPAPSPGKITAEQIAQIKKLTEDPINLQRFEKALSAYKVSSIEGFNTAQAARIIDVLQKPIKKPEEPTK